MTTSLADDVTNEDWAELRDAPRRGLPLSRAESLWTLFGLGLLGAFLLFVALTGI
jgi:hypothetical protein